MPKLSLSPASEWPDSGIAQQPETMSKVVSKSLKVSGFTDFVHKRVKKRYVATNPPSDIRTSVCRWRTAHHKLRLFCSASRPSPMSRRTGKRARVGLESPSRPRTVQRYMSKKHQDFFLAHVSGRTDKPYYITVPSQKAQLVWPSFSVLDSDYVLPCIFTNELVTCRRSHE